MTIKTKKRPGHSRMAAEKKIPISFTCTKACKREIHYIAGQLGMSFSAFVAYACELGIKQHEQSGEKFLRLYPMIRRDTRGRIIPHRPFRRKTNFR